MRLTEFQGPDRWHGGMEQDVRAPADAVATTVTTAQRLGRLLVPLGIAAAITGGGLLVFFALVTGLLV